MREHRKKLCTRMCEALGLVDPPLAAYYSDTIPEGALGRTAERKQDSFCSLAFLKAPRTGRPTFIDRENHGCPGGGFFLGFVEKRREGFEYFISCDKQGRGERFKKTPEIARTFMDSSPPLPAPARYCIFDLLAHVPADVTPVSVIFLAEPDVLSGLFTLANYGRTGQNAVIAPFTAGCGSIVYEPRRQAMEPEPKAVLGMFDISVRAHVESNILSLAVPHSMFLEMAENIDGSFLEIEPWTKLRARSAKAMSDDH